MIDPPFWEHPRDAASIVAALGQLFPMTPAAPLLVREHRTPNDRRTYDRTCREIAHAADRPDVTISVLAQVDLEQLRRLPGQPAATRRTCAAYLEQSPDGWFLIGARARALTPTTLVAEVRYVSYAGLFPTHELHAPVRACIPLCAITAASFTRRSQHADRTWSLRSSFAIDADGCVRSSWPQPPRLRDADALRVPCTPLLLAPRTVDPDGVLHVRTALANGVPLHALVSIVVDGSLLAFCGVISEVSGSPPDDHLRIVLHSAPPSLLERGRGAAWTVEATPSPVISLAVSAAEALVVREVPVRGVASQAIRIAG